MTSPFETRFRPDEAYAVEMDASDPLRSYRERFHVPKRPDRAPVIYLAGNSLGLQPRETRALIEQELADWASLAVDAHFEGVTPWYSYHEVFREPAARLVGAVPGEVVLMNSLTVNLHLMMVSFYRPTLDRHKIVIDWPAFPSDLYAVKTQLRYHGYEPPEALIELRPREGENTIRTEDVEDLLRTRGAEIALIVISGVNYFTGQFFDLERITAAGKSAGCVVGFDLAHAAGNVPLRLHDWGADFAVWCNYKYLNSGPGAVGGCYVHEDHGNNLDLPRFAGWWGNDPAKRFRMHLEPEFIARSGADGWQVSNPPILAMAPIRASLAMFDEATMPALRAKSKMLTGYLDYLIRLNPKGRYEIITPQNPSHRGCQLSILVHDRPKELFKALQDAGVVCDYREPNVVRVAPVPLYNTFHEVWTFAQVLGQQ